MGFTPCKTEELLQGIELQEKEEKKFKSKQEKLFRKNLKVSINFRMYVCIYFAIIKNV